VAINRQDEGRTITRIKCGRSFEEVEGLIDPALVVGKGMMPGAQVEVVRGEIVFSRLADRAVSSACSAGSMAPATLAATLSCQKMSDGAAFLWRSELAGRPRDAAAWRASHSYANGALPRPGNGLADLAG
jgi:hypothetical protein